MAKPFSNGALSARDRALDAAITAVQGLKGDHSDLISNIELAKVMLGEGHVRAAHSVFRDVTATLDAANAPNPELAKLIRAARNSE